MKNNTRSFVRYWSVFVAILLSAALLGPEIGRSQDTKASAPVAAAKDAAPAVTPTTPEKNATPAAAKAQNKTSPPANEQSAASSTPTNAKESAAPKSALPAVESVSPKLKTTGAAPPSAIEGKAVPKESTALPAGKTEPSAATKLAEDTGATEPVHTGWSPWLLALTLLALFVGPMMIGNYLRACGECRIMVGRSVSW